MSADSGSPRLQSANKLQQRLADCYARGAQLMGNRDFDYAHTMFAECVVHEPRNTTYVEALLRNLRLKVPRPKKKLLQVRRRNTRPLRLAIESKEWSKAFRLGIQCLNTDPWDMDALRNLAYACEQNHFNEAELAYLKHALDADPKNVAVNEHCARSLARMGQFDQAIACWHRIEKLRKGDRAASLMISKLSEEKLKYPDGKPPVTAVRVEPAPSALPTESTPTEFVELPLSPSQKLERAILTTPQDPSNYVALANLQVESEQFQQAEATVGRGIGACGERPILIECLERVQRMRSDVESMISKSRRSKNLDLQHSAIHVPWFELLFAFCIITLMLQMFPVLGSTAGRLLDFRKWSRLTWLLVNVGIVFVLYGIRVWITTFKPWREQVRRATAKPAIRRH